ncbi:MAG: hypothetical protein QM655_04285 [Nocardioidaceae bacterium]
MLVVSACACALWLMLVVFPGGREGGQQAASGADASARMIDVLHNPPVFVTKGRPVSLEFETVCKGQPCEKVSGKLDLTTGEGRQVVFESVSSDGIHWKFEVPADVVGEGFTYRADFEVATGTATWPADSGGDQRAQGRAIAFAAPVTIDLGESDFDAGRWDRGRLVVSSSWGSGPEQVGVDDSGVGPTSFDIGPDGSIVVLDTANARLVRIDHAGNRTTGPIGLDRDYPDLAVGDDGQVYVLYPNGGGTGNAYVGRYGAGGGEQIDRIQTSGGGAGMIRARGSRIEVFTQDSAWVPIVADGVVLDSADRDAASSPAIHVGEDWVYLKHVGDHEVRIALVDEAGTNRSWSLRSTTSLGASQVEVLPDGDLVVMQSRFTDDKSEYVLLRLSRDGTSSESITVPFEQFAETTAGSEFRLDGDQLYMLRSTRQASNIYVYDLSEGKLQ